MPLICFSVKDDDGSIINLRVIQNASAQGIVQQLATQLGVGPGGHELKSTDSEEEDFLVDLGSASLHLAAYSNATEPAAMASALELLRQCFDAGLTVASSGVIKISVKLARKEAVAPLAQQQQQQQVGGGGGVAAAATAVMRGGATAGEQQDVARSKAKRKRGPKSVDDTAKLLLRLADNHMPRIQGGPTNGFFLLVSTVGVEKKKTYDAVVDAICAALPSMTQVKKRLFKHLSTTNQNVASYDEWAPFVAYQEQQRQLQEGGGDGEMSSHYALGDHLQWPNVFESRSQLDKPRPRSPQKPH